MAKKYRWPLWMIIYNGILFMVAFGTVTFVTYWRWWLDKEGITAPMLPNSLNDPNSAPLPPPFN